MKLINFEQKTEFEFTLTFENRERIDVDLEPLVGAYLSEEHLETAEIDTEWGCLQFKNGLVDVEPRTLYKFALGASDAQAA